MVSRAGGLPVQRCKADPIVGSRTDVQDKGGQLAWCRHLASLHIPSGLVRGPSGEMDASPLREHLLYFGNLFYRGKISWPSFQGNHN